MLLMILTNYSNALKNCMLPFLKYNGSLSCFEKGEILSCDLSTHLQMTSLMEQKQHVLGDLFVTIVRVLNMTLWLNKSKQGKIYWGLFRICKAKGDLKAGYRIDTPHTVFYKWWDKLKWIIGPKLPSLILVTWVVSHFSC